MTTPTMSELYGEFWGAANDAFAAAANKSLGPRAPAMLFEQLAALGVRPGERLLDVGGRDAAHAIELAECFAARVLMIDPVAHHVATAGASVRERGLAARVAVAQAGIEAIPADDGAIDHVWCRDVLVHVDLPRGLAECARVLRPGGGVLVYQTFATELLEPREARRLYTALGIVEANMAPAYLEQCARAAGLAIEHHDVVGSEWREHQAEAGGRDVLDDLLWIARIRRARAAFDARFGAACVEAQLAGCEWGVFQMLGKLRSMIYRLRKPRAGEAGAWREP